MVREPKKVDSIFLNSWYVDINGLIEINGKSYQKLFTVTFTSDYGQESIIIADESTGVKFMVAFGNIQKMIELARKESKNG